MMAVKRENFYRRDPSKALSGMIGLSLEERGVYNTIIDLLYSTWRPLEDDRAFIANWCGCAVQKVNPIIRRLIERGRLISFEEHGRTFLSDEHFEAERATVKGATTTRSDQRKVGEKSGGVEQKSEGVEENPPGCDEKNGENQNVVSLDKSREDQKEPPNPPQGDLRDPAFEEAVRAYPEAGRVTVSLEAMGEAWDDAIDGGASPAALLAASKAFAAGQYADQGGKVPRFDRWLRKDLWKLVSTGPQLISPLAWNGPADFLTDLRSEMGEAHADAALRMARWDQDRAAIVTASPTVAALIRKGGPATLRAHRIQVLEERAA
jgi:uncharacterized protein YdaU (DUF1376 family)